MYEKTIMKISLKCSVISLCIFVVNPIVYAGPMVDVDKGNVKIGVSTTIKETSDLNGLVVDNNNSIRGDIYYGLTDKWAIGLRHKDIDVQKEKSKTFMGRTFSTNIDGNLKESDLLFLYRLTKKDSEKPFDAFFYTGLKRLEGELYPKTISGSVKFMGRIYTGKIDIEGKHKVVLGAMVGTVLDCKLSKTTSAWLDAHYSHYINGFEVGINQKLSPYLGLDVSYFYDKYRYKDYHFTDKGGRVGLSFHLNPSKKRKK